MNVLVLTDLSKVAQNAGAYAVKFLEEVPAHFYLLNIETDNDGLDNEEMERRRDTILGMVENRIETLKKTTSNPDHRFTALFSTENLVNAARKFMSEKQIDLIVMGAVRKDYAEDTILGVHTYEIIKKIKCNLLAIPEAAQFEEAEKVIIPIDYSVSLDKKIFKVLNHPQMLKKASFIINEIQERELVTTGPEEKGERLFSRFDRNRLRFKTVTNSGFISEDLLMEVQERYDMIVLLGKNLSICDRFLHTDQGVQASIPNRLPILVLHD